MNVLQLPDQGFHVERYDVIRADTKAHLLAVFPGTDPDIVLGGDPGNVTGARAFVVDEDSWYTLTSTGWVAADPPPFVNPMTAEGDLIIGDTAGAADVLPIGTEGQILMVVSGKPAWVDFPT